ncbi:MAG: Hsp20 family protein [SAR202 cluster bacterium]|nr:Hsp20 family protein [SAR202 cluster bacterium]
MESKRIKEIRGDLGLSQERFARLLSVSLQTVRRWESGLSKPLPILNLKLEELQTEAMAQKRGAGSMLMKKGLGEKGEATLEVGLGGLFKGIGGFLDLVSNMVEEGTEETTRAGGVEDLGGKLKGVYGFSVRVGLGGKPVIEQFGNVHETETGAMVTETREPLVDVLDEGDRFLVVAEIPGVREQDIQVDVAGDILGINAETKGRKYQKEVLLPSAVDSESMESSYRNGILEIKLPKK